MNNSLRKIVFDVLVDLIKSDSNVHLEFKGKINRIRFAPKQFAIIDKVGDGSWDGTDYIILFEIENRKDRLDILLVIGPGSSETRQKLFSLALQFPEVFNSASRGELSPIFKRIFRKNLIDYTNYNIKEEKLKEVITSRYNDFKGNEYKKIVTYIQNNYNQL